MLLGAFSYCLFGPDSLNTAPCQILPGQSVCATCSQCHWQAEIDKVQLIHFISFFVLISDSGIFQCIVPSRLGPNDAMIEAAVPPSSWCSTALVRKASGWWKGVEWYISQDYLVTLIADRPYSLQSQHTLIMEKSLSNSDFRSYWSSVSVHNSWNDNQICFQYWAVEFIKVFCVCGVKLLSL